MLDPLTHSPTVAKIAQHLRNAANEIAKFDNMPEFNSNPILQAIQDLTRDMTALQGDMVRLRTDVRIEVTALRRDMTSGFDSLRASNKST